MAHPLTWEPGGLLIGYIVAGLVSGIVGAADILTRYKDNPFRALWTMAGAFYLAVNLIFGVLAFWLSMVLGIIQTNLTPVGLGLSVELIRDGLVVGFGAILLLRAVAFNLNIGGKNAEMDAKTIVDALLAACDQDIDRALAKNKDADVRSLMKGIPFDAAKEFVPTYALSLLQQNEERATRLGGLVREIAAFKNGDMSERAEAERSFLLGNTLINVLGKEVTKGVLEGFRAHMAARAGPPASPAASPAPSPPPGAPPPPPASVSPPPAATPAAGAGRVSP